MPRGSRLPRPPRPHTGKRRRRSPRPTRSVINIKRDASQIQSGLLRITRQLDQLVNDMDLMSADQVPDAVFKAAFRARDNAREAVKAISYVQGHAR